MLYKRNSLICMQIIFVLGAIGAGKSTYIHNEILSNNSIKYLSADLLKKRENLTYQEARKKMGKIIQRSVEKRESFITEGTGQHDDMYDLFKSYSNDPEIDLQIMYIDIDLETALKRNKNRVRVLDDETVKRVYRNSQARKHLWKDFNCRYIDYRDIEKKESNPEIVNKIY